MTVRSAATSGSRQVRKTRGATDSRHDRGTGATTGIRHDREPRIDYRLSHERTMCAAEERRHRCLRKRALGRHMRSHIVEPHSSDTMAASNAFEMTWPRCNTNVSARKYRAPKAAMTTRARIADTCRPGQSLPDRMQASYPCLSVRHPRPCQHSSAMRLQWWPMSAGPQCPTADRRRRPDSRQDPGNAPR